MVHDGCNYFSFWAIFCPFTEIVSNIPKNQNFEKLEKRHGDIIIIHKCTKNHDHMLTVPEIWHVTDVIIFYFGLFFALLPP